MRLYELFLVGLGAALIAACNPTPQTPEQGERPPNFIIIFCDDMGYADIGPFGSENYRTPHLDRMAAEGMKLTSFYVTSGVCTPSRSSLMTGCYPRRVGLHQNEQGRSVLFPGDSHGIHPDEILISEILRDRGYATGVVGKWHLGDQPAFLPTRHGFDYYFGIPYSNDMGREGYQWRIPRAARFPFFDLEAGYIPIPVLRNEEVIETEPDQGLLTRRYTEEAVSFIQSHRNEPFFLYVPHTMPHQPVHASEAFLGKSVGGTYGDTIEEIDWSTGQIIETLRELGIDNETLVLFTSDNGASGFAGSNSPLRGEKGSTWEGGMRVPCVVRWPGKIPAGSVCDELATTMDILPTLAHLAGGRPPNDRVIDGKDIWPLLSAQPGATSPHEHFFYYHIGNLEAVRSGNWKLHLEKNLGSQEAPDEAPELPALYDLSTDMTESANIAAQHPEVVTRLMALAEQARTDLGDAATGQEGENVRPFGKLANAKPLVTAVVP